MLMGHPPPLSARGREHRPHGGFAGLTPGHVSMMVQELVACDAEVQEALADPFEAVHKMAQAGAKPFHRVAVHTGPVRVTTRIRARPMVDRPMVIVGRSAMVDGVCLGEGECFKSGDGLR